MRERGLARLGALLREATVSALNQPVATLLTVAMIAGMCTAVLLTSGTTDGAERAVISTLDSAGTRSIVVRTDAAGVDTGVLDRLANIDGIGWAAAFGPAADVQNTAFPGGARVPLRLAWGHDWTALGLPASLIRDGTFSWVSPAAAGQLGMTLPAGGVRDVTGGREYSVAGALTVPEELAFLEPLQLAPQPDGPPQPIALLVVVAATPGGVAPVAAAVTSLLAAQDPGKIKLETSQNLAALRSLIQGQLGGFGRSLTLAILAVTALLSAAILYGMVTLRRRDYGRRRALGAPQQLVLALIMLQTALLGAVGAVLGSGSALLVLALTRQPVPGVPYVVAIGVLAVGVSVLASPVPGIAASRREPIRELRVP